MGTHHAVPDHREARSVGREPKDGALIIPALRAGTPQGSRLVGDEGGRGPAPLLAGGRHGVQRHEPIPALVRREDCAGRHRAGLVAGAVQTAVRALRHTRARVGAVAGRRIETVQNTEAAPVPPETEPNALAGVSPIPCGSVQYPVGVQVQVAGRGGAIRRVERMQDREVLAVAIDSEDRANPVDAPAGRHPVKALLAILDQAGQASPWLAVGEGVQNGVAIPAGCDAVNRSAALRAALRRGAVQNAVVGEQQGRPRIPRLQREERGLEPRRREPEKRGNPEAQGA